MRLALFLFACAIGCASPVQAQDSERRALDAERRALDAERRALEAERRAALAEQKASAGASVPPVPHPASEACLAATQSFQRTCAVGSVDPLWQTPQCADAEKLVRRYCG
jgi:hypothetical protein